MKEELHSTAIPVHRQAIYNPGRLTDPEIKASYIARQSLLEMLLEDIRETRPGGIPQHHLIIGQRGMGKTTLLRRIDVALREDPNSARFIPLSFPEEQWTLDRLSKLWLNCLDSLADTLEREGDGSAAVQIIDEVVERLSREYKNEQLLSESAENSFLQLVQDLDRCPVLLVDNLDLVFERLSKHELNRLRAFLMRAGAPVLVGACISPPSETSNYTAAFYDHFKTHYLDRLSAAEMREVLLRLAADSGNKSLEAHLTSEVPRLMALHALTGGNPRTTAILFQIFSKGFSQEAYQDLEALLDWITPFYKARLEELSAQAQVIVSALATHWEPATAGQLAAATRLENRQVSPQLDRLKKAGIVEEVLVDPEDEIGPLPTRRTARTRTGYQLAERFFNIWFLMRQATRRDRRNLTFLTRFIECAHTPAERSAMAHKLLRRHGLSRAERIYGLALEPAVSESALRYRLHDHVQQEIVEASLALKEKIEELIDPSEIPAHRFAFAEVKVKLRNIAHGAGMSPDEFTDAFLGSPVMIQFRDAIANKTLDAKTVKLFINLASDDLKQIEQIDGNDATAWFSDLLRAGTVVDFADPAQITEALQRADTRQKARVCIRYAISPVLRAVGEGARATVRRLFTPELGSLDAQEWHEWGNMLVWFFADTDTAEAAFREAVRLKPQHAQAWDDLADILAERKSFTEAEAAYQKAIESDAKHTWPLMGLARMLSFQLGRFQEAEALLRKAIEIEPNDSLIWATLGDLLGALAGREQEAESAIRKAINIDPRTYDGWISLGLFLGYHVKRYSEAESAFRKAIELQPRSPSGWFSLGLFLSTQPDRSLDSESALRRAIDIDPKDSQGWIWLAGVLADGLNRFGEAESALRKAIELAPTNALAWSQLATLLHDTLSRFDEAEDAYRKAISLDGSNIDSWLKLGDLYHYKLARFNEAEAAYRHATELDPLNTWGWNNLGLLLADCLGRYEDASNALQKAIEIDPENSLAPAYNLVSVLRDQLGRTSEAERVFAKLGSSEDKALQSGLLLHPALFAAYADNWGITTEYLGESLDLIVDESAFPPSIFPGWMRATAVFLHLGYGAKLLQFLSDRGDDQRLRPWYEAIRAHVRGDRQYLRNIPAEMQDIAGMLYDEINTRLQNLPDTTRRWSPPSGTKRLPSRRRK